MLRLLHISDIHFAGGSTRAPEFDVDTMVRSRMLDDLARIRDRLGAFDGVLLVGDVAARGKEADYKMASAFLDAATDAVGCPDSQVVCVPGNHDVDRGAHGKVHGLVKIAVAGAFDKSGKIQEYLESSETGESLYRPFAAYNAFASRYGCQTTMSSPLFDPKDFKIDEDHILRVHGVNSAWLCDGTEQPGEGMATLAAGEFQAFRVGGDLQVISVSLCHHPAAWLADGQRLDAWLSRAHLRLTGHEHTAAFARSPGGAVLIASGAVNPSHEEEGWAPAYNVIELEVDTSEVLIVRVHTRAWTGADFATSGADDPTTFTIDLRRWRETMGTIGVAPGPAAQAAAEPMDSAQHDLVFAVLSAPPDLFWRAAEKMAILPADADLTDQPGSVASETAAAAIAQDRLGELHELIVQMRHDV